MKLDLLGYTVEEVWVGPQEHELRLVTAPEGEIPRRTFSLDTYGDCCSESWWADVVGVKQLLGARIGEVADIPMPTPDDDRTRQEVDEAYGLRIKTDRGVCDLVYRNSSNGYYGGSCTGGWVENDLEDFRRITEDWSA